jgi:hypothetical protein
MAAFVHWQDTQGLDLQAAVGSFPNPTGRLTQHASPVPELAHPDKAIEGWLWPENLILRKAPANNNGVNGLEDPIFVTPRRSEAGPQAKTDAHPCRKAAVFYFFCSTNRSKPVASMTRIVVQSFQSGQRGYPID